MVLAAELPPEVGHLHAHFLHTPASVARYAAILCRLPWTCSAHAKDIWTSPEWEKREKLADCRWAVTCTAQNRRHLEELSPDRERVELVYHGLDLGRFPAAAREFSSRDGALSDAPVRMLSVGRAVEKKGYGDLLDALAKLPRDLHWSLVHVGGGPLLPKLRRQAKRLGISSRLSWLGARPQPEVIEQYRVADLFVLACRVAEDGDRDGLPNVLMEAQCQGLACIATRVSAIPELLEDGVNGVLVPERDVVALAGAIERLVRDPQRRAAMGRAGNERVRARFSFERGIDRLVARFDEVDGRAVAQP
jgi:glycosyltransferase involved in cell wall biosynthesis